MRTVVVCAIVVAVACHHEPTAPELLAAGDLEMRDESVPAAQRAVALYEKALALSPPPALQAKLLAQMAEAFSVCDLTRLEPSLAKAVAAARAAGDESAALEYRVSLASFKAGSVDKRIDELRALLAEAHAGIDRRVEAYAAGQLGNALKEALRLSEALAVLSSAEPLFRASVDPRITFLRENTLAEVYYFSADAEQSLAHIDPALGAARAAHLPLEEAQLYGVAGNVHYWYRHDSTVAMVFYARSLGIFLGKGMGNTSSGIIGLLNLGRAQAGLGDKAGAVRTLEAALAAARRHQPGEVNITPDGIVCDVLYGLGGLYLEVGRNADAAAAYREETELSKQAGDDIRYLNALLASARLANAENRFHDALAFLQSAEAPDARLTAKVTDEELKLPYNLTARHAREIGLISWMGIGDWNRAFALSESLRGQELVAALGGNVLDGAATQALLDADTTFVELTLTETNAYAFVVGSRSIEAIDLGSSKTVEEVARNWYELASSDSAAPDALAAATRALADRILAPVAPHLHGRRVVLVPDKTLHYVAFAALPLPDGKLMIDRFELVTVPSASVLAALRARHQQRPGSTHGLAVLADPIFDAGDARLGGARPPLTLAVRAGENLVRLPATHDEADAISELFPKAQVFRVEGAEATRAAALGPQVASARYVHYATHAVLDNVDPDKSGLIFSGGSVRIPDIEASHLAADLVVLSACKTAIGKRFDGEGLVGLTRAFLKAGVPRVVSSLWQVDDVATAELMARFYRGMLDGKLSAPAALRQAQLQARDTPARLWAGFAFYGDWR